MGDSLITVIVPVYNVEKYLNRCIESITKQTYKNLEIILVDDGSPDNCPAMCDEWAQKDSRIKVVHKQNAGLGMARNTGIENANGSYIFFFDSDDYVDTSIVEECVRSAERYNSDAVVYGRCEVYDDGRVVKKEIKSPKEVFTSQEVTNELLPAMFTYDMGFGVSAWGKMFSLTTIRNASLRFVSEREIISEDSYFALEFFSHASTVSIVDESLYFYYKRESSLSRAYREDRQKHNDTFLQKSLDYIKTEKLPANVTTHLTARYHMFVIAAMKHIVAANMPWPERKVELRKIYNDTVFRGTIKSKILQITPFKIAIFLVLIKFRLYFVCDGLLKRKMR